MSPRPFSSMLWRGSLSPIVLAAATVMCIGLGLLHESARVVRRAEIVRRSVDAAATRIEAEAAILRTAESGADSSVQSIGGRTVRVDAGDDGWFAAVGAADRPRCFHSPRIQGAGHAAFERACSVLRPELQDLLVGASPLGPSGMPRLQPDLAASATACDRSDVFVRDSSLALAQWEVGTDGDDYVFGAGAGQALAAGSEVLVVSGHLWLPAGDGPWTVRLSRDVLVVVRGNLYLGRSVQVIGGGRLVFYVLPAEGAVAFADRDGNGRWSGGDVTCHPDEAFRGPIEGGGAVFFGLPRSTADRLSCDAGLVAHGELQVWTDAEVVGPLVVGAGVTRNGGGAKLRATGGWKFQVERESVPGLESSGRPRPGLMRECDPSRRVKQNQALYLSSPSR